MCYIFSSLVYTVKGTEKTYLKHQEVKSKRLVWAEKKVVYFFSVRLREKYLQFTGGNVMIQVQCVCVSFSQWLNIDCAS